MNTNRLFYLIGACFLVSCQDKSPEPKEVAQQVSKKTADNVPSSKDAKTATPPKVVNKAPYLYTFARSQLLVSPRLRPGELVRIDLLLRELSMKRRKSSYPDYKPILHNVPVVDVYPCNLPSCAPYRDELIEVGVDYDSMILLATAQQMGQFVLIRQREKLDVLDESQSLKHLLYQAELDLAAQFRFVSEVKDMGRYAAFDVVRGVGRLTLKRGAKSTANKVVHTAKACCR